MRFWKMGVVILILSLTVIHFANWPPETGTPVLPAPQKTGLIVYASGQINDEMVEQLTNALNALKLPIGVQVPDILVLSMNSTGGYYEAVLKMGLTINIIKNRGGVVDFFAGANSSKSVCTSGCFLLSTFANDRFGYNYTRYGFNHNYEDVASIYDSVSTVMYLNFGQTSTDFQRTMNRTWTLGIDYFPYPIYMVDSIVDIHAFSSNPSWKMTIVSITGDNVTTSPSA